MKVPTTTFARALVVVAAARLAIRPLAYRDAVALIDALARALTPAPRDRPPRSARDLAATVEHACRLLPGASTCLPDAFAGCALLRREGLPAEVRIGVRREPGGGLRAHAWVEVDGDAVLGASGEEYWPFPRPVW
jgi:hypothetical protein